MSVDVIIGTRKTQSKVGDRTLGALWSLSSLNNKHNKDQETHT